MVFFSFFGGENARGETEKIETLKYHVLGHVLGKPCHQQFGPPGFRAATQAISQQEGGLHQPAVFDCGKCHIPKVYLVVFPGSHHHVREGVRAWQPEAQTHCPVSLDRCPPLPPPEPLALLLPHWSWSGKQAISTGHSHRAQLCGTQFTENPRRLLC